MDDLEWIRILELSEWHDEETDSIVAPSEVSLFSDDGEDYSDHGEDCLADSEMAVMTQQQPECQIQYTDRQDDTVLPQNPISVTENNLTPSNLVSYTQHQLQSPPWRLIQASPQQLFQPSSQELLESLPQQPLQPSPQQSKIENKVTLHFFIILISLL